MIIMGSDNNSALESRFRFLKNQLSDLGYKDEFTPDSLPLLEALVADFIQTSDALKHYKELSQKCLQACQELETFVDAYKKDNARLLVELNSLHLNTISDKSIYEQRILDLEKEIQVLESKNAIGVKQCSKGIIRGKYKECRVNHNARNLNCHSSSVKCDYCTKLLQNKDNEIKQLHLEILRLNDLLSGGRPIDVLCTHEQKRKNVNSNSCCSAPNSVQLHHLLSAFHGQHEAKCTAVNVIERCDKSIDEQYHKLHNEITELKTTCKNLENVKAELHKELDSLRQSNQHLECINKKLDKDILELTKINQESQAELLDKEKKLLETNKRLQHELLEMKRTSQENSAEKSDIEIQYKKCLAEKKHLSNRVNELSVIERDLTIEVSRLSNINAIHKRHILELENKLLDVHQSKQKECFTSSFDLLINKKPLEKRCTLGRRYIDSRTVTKNKTAKTSDVGNSSTYSKVTENKVLPIIAEIRDKYQKQLESIQGNDNDVLSFIKRLEEETNLSVESSKAVQKQLESQLESMTKQLELVEKLKNDAERELCVVRDKNAILEEQIAYKESRISHLEQVTSNLHKQMDSPTTNDIRSSEEIYRKSALELERLRNHVRDLEKIKDSLQIDNRKLQNELASITQDYLSCKKEVEKSKKETQEMRIQMHDYIAKVRAAEETLQQKDKERSEMLDHFRTLTIEATQLESNNHSLESEARSTRNALRNAESKIVDLEHLIQNKDALISGYEEQLSELTKTIASLEAQLANSTAQREKLKNTLDSCEELRCQMDTERDTLSSTVSSIKMSNKRSEKELLRLQTENRCLQEQIANEKINVATLEKLLSETRKSKIEHDISVSELQEEIRGLKANIKCLQESLENLGKKLKQSQHEAADYQRQLVQLNRELTNVQFERIRNSPSDNINYSTL